MAIGSRLGDAVTQGYTLLDMAGSVPIVQVHPDASEIGRVFRPALGIVSDLNAFAHTVAALEPVRSNWARWTADFRSLREAQRAVPNYEGTLNLGTAMRELETLLTWMRWSRGAGSSPAGPRASSARDGQLISDHQRCDGLQRSGCCRGEDRVPLIAWW
jgi:thiamine pyrophosphate-dependent acetolactate synthase large subunit-like protein